MISTTTTIPFPVERVCRRREWHCRSISRIGEADLAHVAEILGRHAAESRIETWERHRSDAMGRQWAPVRLEIDGHRQGVTGSPEQSRQVRQPREVRLSTWAQTAALVVRPDDVRVTIEDEPALARRTLTAIRRILRPRRRPLLALAVSEWGVPALALLAPVLLGALAVGTRTLAMLVLAGVGAPLVAWLWWYHQVWLFRTFVDLPEEWLASMPAVRTEVAA